MKAKAGFLILTIVGLAILSGCTTSSSPGTVAEGVILAVQYQTEDGHTTGFTRLNESKAVPGGNGSWNVDARGRLTRDFLIITRPQRPELGPLVIPAHRLVRVEFGDGGIKKVDENQPKSGSDQPTDFKTETSSGPPAGRFDFTKMVEQHRAKTIQDLEARIEAFKVQLKDPTLAAETTASVERRLAADESRLKTEFDAKKRDAEHQTHVQLWESLNEASEKKDAAQIAKAERELADYLTRKLEVTDKKAYPAGMSLKEVMEQYRKLPLSKTEASALPPDSFQTYIVDSIEEKKLKLQDPKVDTWQKSQFAKAIAEDQVRLVEHHLQFRAQAAKSEVFRREQEAGRERFAAKLASMMSEHSNTMANARAKHERVLAEHEVNVKLWDNVHAARSTKDPAKIAQAERELADYLIKQLESIDKKDYPHDMSLEQVMEYYRKHPLNRYVPNEGVKTNEMVKP